MPPIRRKGPRGGLVSTRIPLNSINSVATNAANKRQPNEADQIDNALVSLERGFEKRAGFEVVPQNTIAGLTSWDSSLNSCKYDLYNLPILNSSNSPADLFFYWYSINEDNTFLIAINYDATGATDKLFYVYKIDTTNNTWEDKTPAYQWDPTDTTIASGNATIASFVGTGKPFATYAAALAAGVVNKDSRSYITYKTSTKAARDSLRVVALGANLIVLNTQVYAGFSSDYKNDANDGKLFGLDGTLITSPATIDDIEGRRVTYYSASKVMKVYDKGDDATASTSDDILLGWKPGIITGTVNTAVTTATPTLVINTTTSVPSSTIVGSSIVVNGNTYTISACTAASNASTLSLTLSSNISSITVGTPYTITITGAAYIPAGDYYYYQTSQAYLGQRVNDLSGVRLPPETDDWYSTNGNATTSDTKSTDMLKALYDADTRYAGTINGRGKIYYCVSPYLNATSGYYRVIGFPEGLTTTVSGSSKTGYGNPYLQKVRTPDEHSYIDPRRMPQKITVGLTAGAVVSWSIGKIAWAPRTSGDKKTNPGPSIFKTADGSALKHVQIKSMAVFKNRLWFSADDVVFSSQTGKYENLFINDPSNITVTDPIDIRASSNQYAEISSMVPFQDYLFIDTKAKTQFQLMSASSMEISPTNVAVVPSTFYSTSQFVLPQLIGSRLYFFGPQRMYLFIGKSDLGYSSAVEVSSAATNYLPINYRSICTAPAQDSIVMVSEENPNQLYFNMNRFSGERVIQNSFFRYVLDTEYNIQSIQNFNNHLYIVTKLTDGVNTTYLLMRNYMLSENVTVPRMDKLLKVKLITGATGNVSYDTATGLTTFKLPSINYSSTQSRIVLAAGWTSGGEDLSGLVIPDYTYTGPGSLIGDPYTFVVKGDYATGSNGKYVYFGELFETRVQLSTLFVRDENNNIIDGVLNLRTGVIRHYNTGNYDIEVTHRGRTPLVSQFVAQRPDFTLGEDTLPLDALQNQGEFVAKIYGYSDSTKISLVSNYTTPMNITNMEFKGKFKQKYTTIN